MPDCRFSVRSVMRRRISRSIDPTATPYERFEQSLILRASQDFGSHRATGESTYPFAARHAQSSAQGTRLAHATLTMVLVEGAIREARRVRSFPSSHCISNTP